jgi:hypothetical protein
MAGEAMNVRGPCSSCGAQLATDQRYCVECGQRVGPPMALPYAIPAPLPAPTGASRWAFTLPIPLQTASIFAALALGFGVVVGTAISPNLAGIVAAPAPTVVAEAPPPDSSPPPPAGGSSAANTASSLPAPVTTVPASSGGGGGDAGGGGGGGKKKKQKKQKEQPLTFAGTVVRTNPIAQSYAIATSSGGLIAIHSAAPPNVGDQVASPVRKLKNGTYAEQGVRQVTGSADSASFLGTVTYCADLEHRSTPCSSSPPPDHFVYAVSSVGVSVLVSSPAGTPLPAVGSQVQVGVHLGAPFVPIEPVPVTDFTTYPAPCSPSGSEQTGVPVQDPKTTELTQTSLSVTGQQTNTLLEAVVQQTGCSGGLVLSADDIREAGRDLIALPLPAGVDPAKLAPGQAVQVAVDVDGSGNLTLRGITSDQGAAGADDPAQGQGTLVGS